MRITKEEELVRSYPAVHLYKCRRHVAQLCQIRYETPNVCLHFLDITDFSYMKKHFIGSQEK